MPTPEMPSLYERLGGVYSIAKVVDDFIERIMVDRRLNANLFGDEVPHRLTSEGFKYLVTELICQATGGPPQYAGRFMRHSHQHLMISEREWQVLLDDFQQTLDTFSVPQQEQDELKAIVASTKEEVVAREHHRPDRIVLL